MKPAHNPGPLFIGGLSRDGDFVTHNFFLRVRQKSQKSPEIRGFSFSEFCALIN